MVLVSDILVGDKGLVVGSNDSVEEKIVDDSFVVIGSVDAVVVDSLVDVN